MTNYHQMSPNAIIVSPIVFDALRLAGLLKLVDKDAQTYGYEEDEEGNVRCWLVDKAMVDRLAVCQTPVVI